MNAASYKKLKLVFIVFDKDSGANAQSFGKA